MGDKKRKATPVSTDIPAKKSKKSKTGTDVDVAKPEVTKHVEQSDKKRKGRSSSNVPTADASASKKSRKQAVDFMSDDEQTPTQSKPSTESKKIKPSTPVDTASSTKSSIPDSKKSKKNKKNKKEQQEDLLTADGVNGVVEHAGHEDVETATSHKPVTSSMQAEAERTVDQELKDDFGGFSDEAAEEAPAASEIETEDNAAVLLAGFDSDGEDKYEDENLDASSTLKLSKKKGKEVQMKLSQVGKSGKNEGPGTVYVGRIPHGFYEKEMREYFSQFGEISKLRLSRNKYSGASKHFAFVEFSSNEVAKIVAETMDNYLLFGHLLKCKYAQPDSLHPDTWKGANKKFRKIPHEKLERERLAAPKSEEHWEKKTLREKKKRSRKARKLEALGLELPASLLTSPSEALKQQQLEQAQQSSLAEIEDAEAEPTGAIKPTNGLPKDEIAIKEAKKSETTDEPEEGKKSKRTRKSKKDKTNADSTAKMEAEESKPAVQEAVSETSITKPGVETAEEFISLGADDDNSDSAGKPAATEGSGETGQKKKKKEKERKNLAKARSPKSALTSTKPAPQSPDQSKAPAGVSPVGKDKSSKAKRQESKPAKGGVRKGLRSASA